MLSVPYRSFMLNVVELRVAFFDIVPSLVTLSVVKLSIVTPAKVFANYSHFHPTLIFVLGAYL
jgi:hypothetical protein